jgi:hypothetical protein
MNDERVTYLHSRIKILLETIWDQGLTYKDVQRWLENFQGEVFEQDEERYCALHLLAHFMYFGSREVRILLKSCYRDLFRTKTIYEIRKENNDTLEEQVIEQEFTRRLSRTRFVGMGNPSESGCHLLYYFRQENSLSKENFAHCHEFLKRGKGGNILLSMPDVNHIVFIDDICGSGSQAVRYSKGVLKELYDLDPNLRFSYYCLFATDKGLDFVRNKSRFNDVESVIALDESFEAFSNESRFFKKDDQVDISTTKLICKHYGTRILCDDSIMQTHPLGWNNGQQLLGFFHNTPDNTLPIMWSEGSRDRIWTPIFKRYPKVY